MLWLCIVLPQLPLEALQSSEEEKSIVVTACEGNTRWLVCCNPAAERAGLKPGMNYSTALAIQPEATTLERRLKAEIAALQRLATWAYQFSGSVIVGETSVAVSHARSSRIWLEIGASLKLFGGLRSLLDELERELKSLSYTYELGIAPTLEGAALLARAGVRVACTSRRALLARIRELPLSKLALEDDIAPLLSSCGVRSIGLLLELPRDGIAHRFGPALSNFFDRLTGDAPDPRPAFNPPEKYAADFEFDFEVKSTEALLFPLRRMLREFAGFLRGRDTGCQRFTLSLLHRDVAATRVQIGLSAPDRNAERFFDVVRERLERAEPPAPTIALQLTAHEFSSPTALQADLLNGALRQTEELTHTIDRIAARLGGENLRQLAVVADHRPEASWAHDSFGQSAERKAGSVRLPARPLWLLSEPATVDPSAVSLIDSAPERIESGWWDAHDVRRDYFIARTQDGAKLWVFHDLASDEWRLHGFWA